MIMAIPSNLNRLFSQVLVVGTISTSGWLSGLIPGIVNHNHTITLELRTVGWVEK
jgi:hypothetical protein